MDADRGASQRSLLYCQCFEREAERCALLVPLACLTVAVTVEVFPFTTIFTVTLDEAKERFLIDGQPNPELTLLIEWPYTFQVNTPGYPFWIYALDCACPYTRPRLRVSGQQGGCCEHGRAQQRR